MASSNYSLTPSQLSIPIPEDYKKALDDALTTVSNQSQLLQRAFKSNRLMDVLKVTATIISELRTAILSPKSYYELYLTVFNELLSVSSFLRENAAAGPSFGDLYEVVQYTGNVLPRLYLMVTVGTVYAKLQRAPKKEIFPDLLDMCRGIQHPVRGLFLREYLCSLVRDQLPCSQDPNDPDGFIEDTISFMMSNFVEMVKLWVRMQYLGPSRETEKREAERRDLEELIGKNLDRISQIENLTLKLYEEMILPTLLEQIVSCKDVIAQEYLMEVLVQVFPNDYHLATLNKLLEAAGKLHYNVNVKNIVSSIMDRLVRHAKSSEDEEIKKLDLFLIFWDAIRGMIECRENMVLQEKVSLLHNIMNLSFSVYPDSFDNIDIIFSYLAEALVSAQVKRNVEDLTEKSLSRTLIKILSVPLDFYRDGKLENVLNLSNYRRVIEFLDFQSKRNFCLGLLDTFRLSDVNFSKNINYVEKVLNLVESLYLEEKEDQPLDFDEDCIVEDLVEVSKFVLGLLTKSAAVEDISQVMAMIEKMTLVFTPSNVRLRFLLPTIIYETLHVMRRAADSNTKNSTVSVKTVIKTVHDLIVNLEKHGLNDNRKYASASALNRQSQAEQKRLYVWSNDYLYDLCLKLWLDVGLVLDNLGLVDSCYDFLTKAFLIYEDFISDSRAQVQSVGSISSRILSLQKIDRENYESLASKVIVYSARLLKRPDQCKSLCVSAHLYWRKDGLYRDDKRAIDLLRKAEKTAESCIESVTSASLYVEILGHYIYFMENMNGLVSYQQIDRLVENVETCISGANGSNLPEKSLTELENVQEVLKHLKASLSLEGSRLTNNNGNSNNNTIDDRDDSGKRLGELSLTADGSHSEASHAEATANGSANGPKTGNGAPPNKADSLPVELISETNAWK